MLFLDHCSPEKVTPEWVAQVAAGVPMPDGSLQPARGVVINAWFGNRSATYVDRALRYIREGGLVPMVYYVPHAFTPAAKHLQAVRAAVGDEWDTLGAGLVPEAPTVWIDVEKVSEDPPRKQWNMPHLLTSRRLVEEGGKVPGVYTNRPAWCAGDGPDGEWLGSECSDMPLWVADYNGDPAIDLRYPFGGWTAAAAKQWQGTTDVYGIACDLSTFPDVWLAAQAARAGQEATPEPPPDEVAALHAKWATARDLRAQADALNTQAGAIEAEVIARKVALGLQPA